MLTGHRPFDATRPEAVAYQQVHAQPPALPTHARSVQAIHDRLLAKDPTARYASAEALLVDLSDWLAAVRRADTRPQAPVIAG